jgi:anti-sigma-K factor RskA
MSPEREQSKMNYLRPGRLDPLAREYALGTLAGGARRRFERLLAESNAARNAVVAWQERLSPLLMDVRPLRPRERVWQGLREGLFASPASTRTAAARGGSWLGELLSWRSGGVALTSALLCALVLRVQPGWIGLEPHRDALPASYVGLLTDSAGEPTLLASSRRHSRQLQVKLLQPIAVPPGQVALLWGLPQDGGALLVVGVLPTAGTAATVELADSAEKVFFKIARLGVSFEPAGAASPAAPSEPFVLTGHCVKLW